MIIVMVTIITIIVLFFIYRKNGIPNLNEYQLNLFPLEHNVGICIL